MASAIQVTLDPGQPRPPAHSLPTQLVNLQIPPVSRSSDPKPRSSCQWTRPKAVATAWAGYSGPQPHQTSFCSLAPVLYSVDNPLLSLGLNFPL